MTNGQQSKDFVVDLFFTEATASVASMDATPLH
jgi:hypothetical protein